MALDLNNTNNPLKDDLGRQRTASLFWEFRHDKYPFLWTLAEADVVKDGKTVPSLHRIYLSYDHIPHSEWDFAMDMFNSWSHWLRLQESPEIGAYIEKWREELTVKNKSLAVSQLMKAGKTGDVGASKYLAEGKHEPAKRGRPSKEEVVRQRKIAAAEKAEMENDRARVMSIVGKKA